VGHHIIFIDTLYSNFGSMRAYAQLREAAGWKHNWRSEPGPRFRITQLSIRSVSCDNTAKHHRRNNRGDSKS